MQARFPFRFDPTYQRLARLFRVTPDRAWVDLGEEEFEARYGPWLVRTPMSNIAQAEATGPYSFVKTAGPARLAITDRGLTFASNGDRGACISFHSPVAGIDRHGVIRHPTLTVTVLDVDGLLEALAMSRRVAARFDDRGHLEVDISEGSVIDDEAGRQRSIPWSLHQPGLARGLVARRRTRWRREARQ
jgi:hypothetical protein